MGFSLDKKRQAGEFITLSIIERLQDLLYQRPFSRQRYLTWLTILFFLIIGYFFVTLPIVAYDTDMWYHLSGGRYFFDHHHPAAGSYFSFLMPVKSWYNYYWLFQVIIYTLFSQAGYYGLIILRCAVFLATAYFSYRQLIQKGNDSQVMGSVFFFVIATLALTPRELLVRPHLFTYLFIALFLYILEKKRELIWLLPLLGILWSNIHGIEYPVMILIVLAYLAESCWRDWRSKGQARIKNIRWYLILTCYTIFLTPGMTALLETPFDVSYGLGRFEYLYIGELRPLAWQTIFNLSFYPFANIIPTAQHLFIMAALIILPLCLWKRELRLSHAILFAGALTLLFQHLRFGYEFILLTLPLVGHFLQTLAGPHPAPKRPALYAVLPLLLLVVPLLTYADHFKFRPQYPFSATQLPTGIVTFLNRVNVGGKVLNNWNTGGYLNWALHDNYKIAMDLQGAIFSDEDFATVSNAFYNENTFRLFISKYDPSFIAVPLYQSDFPKLIAPYPQFVPVFLDHNEALFVNQDHFRDLAARYRLAAIDPFQVQTLDVEKVGADKAAALYREARQLLAIDPDNAIARWLAGNLLIRRKNYPAALTQAANLIHNMPELAIGYILKADCLRETAHYEEAAHCYRLAIARGATTNMKMVQRNLFVVYNKLHAYKKAYKLYAQVINPFAGNADYREIYELAMSAAAAGKQKDALLFLKIARLKAPPADREYHKKIKDMLALLSAPA